MHTLHPSEVTKLFKQPADYCTELGKDVTTWPTTQPLPTLPGAKEAASTFACFNVLIQPRHLHSMVDARMYVTPKALT